LLSKSAEDGCSACSLDVFIWLFSTLWCIAWFLDVAGGRLRLGRNKKILVQRASSWRQDMRICKTRSVCSPVFQCVRYLSRYLPTYLL
jgi:hypothetical protein